jgi:prepilin-type N-terminal cleavage/methylation domain-containing protein
MLIYLMRCFLKDKFMKKIGISTARTTQPSAFTLIELLVVISIIAILMAIMMPALSRARSMARITMCRSNINTMGIAINVYAADNNDYAPGPVMQRPRPSILNKNNRLWDRQLLPYVGEQHSVFKCPESMSVFRQQINDYLESSNQEHIQTYVMNARLQGWTNEPSHPNYAFFRGADGSGGSPDLSSDPTTARLSNVRNPGNTIYFGDKTGYGGQTSSPNYNTSIGANLRSFNNWFGGSLRRGMDIVPTHRVRIIPKGGDNGYAAMPNGHGAPRCKGDIIIGLGDGSVQTFDLLYDESYFEEYAVHFAAGKTAGGYKFTLH